MCIGGMMNNSWVANTSTVIEGTAKSVDGCWRGGVAKCSSKVLEIPYFQMRGFLYSIRYCSNRLY